MTKHCYVWIETGTNAKGQGTWEQAVALPFTQEQAQALRVFLAALHPDRLFTVSRSKPISHTFRTRA